jgi:AbrB family looped-hinge helix DNA binding protein
MKVTTKGQVTIPLEIRERLSIHPGTDVEFAVEGNVVSSSPRGGVKCGASGLWSVCAVGPRSA